MPTAHLIFFPDPVELTDDQYEEAKSLGHLRASDPDLAKSPAKNAPAAAPDDRPKESK